MNERIRELSYEAQRYALNKITGPDLAGINELWHEKFAELIVKECCLYLENEAERLYGISASEVDPIFQSNFELCAEKCYDNSKGLKEHFGVEE